MKVIIAGSRTITNGTTHISNFFSTNELPLPIVEEIVSGCARGIDKCGELFAYNHRIKIKRFPANWKKYGKGAGSIRNAEMAEYADALIAIWDGKSRGTLDMITRMRELGKPVYVRTIE